MGNELESVEERNGAGEMSGRVVRERFERVIWDQPGFATELPGEKRPEGQEQAEEAAGTASVSLTASEPAYKSWGHEMARDAREAREQVTALKSQLGIARQLLGRCIGEVANGEVTGASWRLQADVATFYAELVNPSR